MLTPFHSAASLIKAAACRRGCPVSSEMVNKAEMFCPHPEALKGRAEGHEDYYSVKKNKGLYIQAPVWGSSGELSSCSFLMCFSLAESNSFPGPRQLHINWPRRQSQGYSAQVLRRCHRQLNIDLEVCSYSLYQPVLLSLFPSFYLPSSSLLSLPTAPVFTCMIVCISLFRHKRSSPFLLLNPSSIDPFINLFFSLSSPPS